MNPFETETMADLCLRQGHRHEALALYRRLVARTTDEVARERMSRRVAAIEASTEIPRVKGDIPAREASPLAPSVRISGGVKASVTDPELPVPGVRTRTTGDELTLEWRLPPETKLPAVELLLVTQGPKGVETETRSLAVERNAGRLVLTVKGLHLARAAAGTRGDDRFVPLARG